MLNHINPGQTTQNSQNFKGTAVTEQNVTDHQPDLFNNRIFEVAQVIGHENQALYIEQNGKQFEAKLAYSCFIEPLASDKVLFYRTPDQSVYVLAILERSEPKPALMKFPQGLQLETPSFQQTAYNWKLQAINTDIFTENANIQASKTQFLGKSVKFISTTISTIAEILTQKLKVYLRNTEKQDQVQAASLTHSATGEYKLTAGYGNISVKHHLSVDGKQIMFN